MRALLKGLLSFLLAASPLAAGSKISCLELVSRIFPSSPSYKLSIKARAQSGESLEARGNIYGGIYFELPLVDPSARRRLARERKEKETLLTAIADYQHTCKMLAFKKDLLRYHRLRIEKSLEDNDRFLMVKEEILELEGKVKRLRAKLLSYDIVPEEAARCHW